MPKRPPPPAPAQRTLPRSTPLVRAHRCPRYRHLTVLHVLHVLMLARGNACPVPLLVVVKTPHFIKMHPSGLESSSACATHSVSMGRTLPRHLPASMQAVHGW